MRKNTNVVVGLCLVFTLVVPNLATDYTVGDSSGWALGTDYTTWTDDKTFKVGDNLVFKYGTSHSVDEVTSADYSSCTSGNSITSDSSGSTTIPLKTTGVHYFICGIPGHCSGGMKLSVKVVAASTSTPSPTSTTPTATTTTPSSPTPTVPESSSASNSLVVSALGVAAVSLVSRAVLSFV